MDVVVIGGGAGSNDPAISPPSTSVAVSGPAFSVADAEGAAAAAAAAAAAVAGSGATIDVMRADWQMLCACTTGW